VEETLSSVVIHESVIYSSYSEMARRDFLQFVIPSLNSAVLLSIFKKRGITICNYIREGMERV
jgi:hypothetical protein